MRSTNLMGAEDPHAVDDELVIQEDVLLDGQYTVLNTDVNMQHLRQYEDLLRQERGLTYHDNSAAHQWARIIPYSSRASTLRDLAIHDQDSGQGQTPSPEMQPSTEIIGEDADGPRKRICLPS